MPNDAATDNTQIQLPPGYEDAKPVTGLNATSTAAAAPSSAPGVVLPPGYEDAKPVSAPTNTGGAGGSWETEKPAGFVGGFLKPQEEAVTGGLNLLARGAEIMGHHPKGSLQSTITHEQPLSTAGELGEVAGNVAQWMSGEEGLKFLGELAGSASELAKASEFIKTPAAWAEYLKASPKAAWLLKAVQGVAKGAVVGGAQGGLQGAATDNAAQGARTGAAFGAGGGAVSEGAGLVKDVIQGQGPAQKAAQAALRTNPWATARANNASLRTTLETPIALLEKDAKASYQAVDKAAGTDIKALYDKLGNLEENIRQTADPDLEARLEKARTETMDMISDARKAVTDKYGPKAATLLDKADGLYKRAQAFRDVQKVFKNSNIVTGNDATGTPEKVLISPAVKALQKLQDNVRYGAPRLEQAFGKDGASALLNKMYEAERAGQTAIAKSELLKTIGKAAAITGGLIGAGDLAKHFLP